VLCGLCTLYSDEWACEIMLGRMGENAMISLVAKQMHKRENNALILNLRSRQNDVNGMSHQ
jgi:hypothetical protein